jgi:TrmH family RNA methyltransferase
VITSPDNPKLKLIRKLAQKKHREREGLCVAEGEDLVQAALAAGLEPVVLLVAGEDVEEELLADVSTLGSGTRVIGVFRQAWSRPGGELSVYLHAVRDPGNVGTIIRSAHALADGPVVLGPGCADPYGPKALRAAMGSTFARPPAKAAFGALAGRKVALVARGGTPLPEVDAEPPVVLCLGAEREGLPAELEAAADARATIPLRADGPDSLNVAMAATVALYDVATRMAAHG